MDGDLTVKEFDKATEMILDAVKRISEIQREALAGKFIALALERGGE
jgi:exosome complex component RRP41